jgi:hypothetical protein
MKLQELIANQASLQILFHFLKSELNEDMLSSYLVSRYLTESACFLSKTEFLQRYNEYINKHKSDFNFDSELYKCIYQENEITVEEALIVLKKIQKGVLFNISDPFNRFLRNEQFITIYKEKKIEMEEKSKVTTILNQNEWIFNNYTIFFSESLKKCPILVSQILCSNFINFYENHCSTNDQGILLAIIDGTLELQTISLKGLEPEKQLCFFMNIFNTLVIHSCLLLEGGSPKNSAEFKVT